MRTSKRPEANSRPELNMSCFSIRGVGRNTAKSRFFKAGMVRKSTVQQSQIIQTIVLLVVGSMMLVRTQGLTTARTDPVDSGVRSRPEEVMTKLQEVTRSFLLSSHEPVHGKSAIQEVTDETVERAIREGTNRRILEGKCKREGTGSRTQLTNTIERLACNEESTTGIDELTVS